MDGTKLDADLVVFATGYGDNRNALRKALGDKVADKLTPLWGLGASLSSAVVLCSIPEAEELTLV